ncbi:thioredoxin family protein [Altererythrobacter sp.]|nr:thioredoxin family protein [Altererythrobacter sp.]
MMRAGLAMLMAMGLSACATTPAPPAKTDHPEARAFTTSADTDAMADVDAALAAAQVSGKYVLIAMGANWCHDSRAFAGWLETPRFAALMAERYEVVLVNAGMPQTGDANNLDVAKRFGIDTLEGTPTVMVLAPDGTLLNAGTAKTWRNAASRSEDAIYNELALLATTESASD